ncbi:MAG: homoserine dehydrogenase [Spirochaetia bacterium]|nr:homoserine dehydrogenase [Spirochaetia bacterium]
MKKYLPKIGLFGLGTVGQGLLNIIQKSSLPFEISAIVDRSFQKKQDLIGKIPASSDPGLILDNQEIDIIVEVIGGVDLPLFIIREALDKKKNVVTANKFLLAQHGYALFSKARENGVKIGFEASVAGAIPIIRNLENIFWYEQIPLLEGILNGTTNYILTCMRTEKKDYPEALADAQRLGLAEADPALDINGTDAAHKLALLASLISKKWIDYNNIYVRGIGNLRINDISWTEKMGYRVKQISRYHLHDGKMFLSVEPSIIRPGHYLWDVEFENNAIVFQGAYSGNHMFVGKGAGSYPTAYSVLSDIMHIIQGNYNPYIANDCQWHYDYPSPIDDNENAFYIRLPVRDEPGVLAQITAILSENHISIASVHQDAPLETTDNPVDIIIVTHKCYRKSIHNILNLLEKSKVLQGEAVFLAMDEN